MAINLLLVGEVRRAVKRLDKFIFSLKILGAEVWELNG